MLLCSNVNIRTFSLIHFIQGSLSKRLNVETKQNGGEIKLICHFIDKKHHAVVDNDDDIYTIINHKK